MQKLIAAVFLVCVWISSASAQTIEPWATYRGNSQRTGNTDVMAGPAAPKVLWVLKSKENYIASPVPVGNRLMVSGLGAFNLGNLACLTRGTRRQEPHGMVEVDTVFEAANR